MHSIQPPEIVALDGVSRVKYFIHIPAIRFLEDLECSQPYFFEKPKLFDAHRGGVNVQASYLACAFSGFDFDIVNRPDCLGYVIDVGLRVFAVNDYQPFVAYFAREDFGFRFDLFEVQLISFDGLVAVPEATINAVVDAVVAQVKRGKGNDTIVIYLCLYLCRRLFHFSEQISVIDVEQCCCFRWRKRLYRQGFRHDFTHLCRVGLRVGGEFSFD